jgi:hypothetical protein
VIAALARGFIDHSAWDPPLGFHAGYWPSPLPTVFVRIKHGFTLTLIISSLILRCFGNHTGWSWIWLSLVYTIGKSIASAHQSKRLIKSTTRHAKDQLTKRNTNTLFKHGEMDMRLNRGLRSYARLNRFHYCTHDDYLLKNNTPCVYRCY